MKNAIEIMNLQKKYPNFSLNNVTFNVPCGCIVGFVGENGAGKTTTIKSILNAINIDSGSISIYGQPHNSAPSAREDIGFVFDECYFHETFTIPQVGKILKGVYKNWDDAYFNQLLQTFGLSSLTGKKDIIKNFSRGMKMKLSLAAALAHHPKLLVLDEATSGLDPIIRDEILDMMLDFIQDENKSILFSSHITSDLEKAADYLVFIHNGSVILSDEKDTILSNYGILHCTKDVFSSIPSEAIVGYKHSTFGVDVLVNDRNAFTRQEDILIDKASIEDIMLYTIKGEHSA